MLELESLIAQRHPRWFAGARAAWTRPLVQGLSRFARLDVANEFLQAHAHLKGFAFVDAVLDFLRVRYTVDQVERERIPRTGRLLIVANHPAGAHDALALLHLVASLREDVRILGNDWLRSIEALRPFLLPVSVFGGAPDAASLEAVHAALEAEQCVIVFPAGEVSRLGWRGVEDGRWRRGFLHFARRSRAAVLPVRIRARNSMMFYGASALYRPLGTALLPREALSRRGTRLDLRIGHPLRLATETPAPECVADVRRALRAIGTRHESVPDGLQALAPPADRRLLVKTLSRLPVLGSTPDGKRIHAGRLAIDSPLLREIGRLREISFRAVGEGTGGRVDLDAFDEHYEHIVLWDAEALEVAGAYRVADGSRILAEHGVNGLYSASLFRYDCRMLPRLAEGAELGRSFVAPAYWNSRSLDYLWLGIGAWLRQNPGVRYLYGSVSASAALPLAAREALVAYYQHYYGGQSDLVRALHPFCFQAQPPRHAGADAEAAFRVLKSRLDEMGVRIPTLYKQYTELCEPGGARFLAFGVDRQFRDAVDGLIEVDLATVRPRKRERYLAVPEPEYLPA